MKKIKIWEKFSEVSSAPVTRLQHSADRKQKTPFLAIKNVFWPKKGSMFSSTLAGIVFAGLFSAIFAFALPYAPGETTNPTCLPTDTNCTVISSVPYTGATTAVDLGSKSLTTTGTGSLGSLTLTTSALTVGNGGTGVSLLTAYAVLAGGTSSGANVQQVSGLGSSGQVLTSNGAGALPTWVTPSGSGATWGAITGTLSNQTDLQAALDAKVPTTTTVNGHALSSNVTVTKSDLSLGNVENTALSTWAGSTNLTTLGTIGTGVWNGTIITSGYGGTGNGFTKFSGPASSEKTFTLPNASATICTTDSVCSGYQASLGFTAENVTNKSTNTSLGSSNTLYPTQNAVKTYVDNLSTGLIWQDPVELINVIGDSNTPIGSPGNADAYFINTGGATGAWAAFAAGDIVQYQTSAWVKIKSAIVGDRFGVSFKSSTTPSGGMTGKNDYLAQVTGGTPGAFTYTFLAPANNYAVFVSNTNDFYHSVSFTYSSGLAEWVQLSASVDYSFSTGLTLSGNAVSVDQSFAPTWTGVQSFNNTLRILEGGSSPTKYTTFQGGDQSADITYTLPIASANGLLKNASGTLSWDTTAYVPTSTTVNGHALSGNVSVTAGDVSLGSVENTALSTWAGSANITTLGTITTGTWSGTAIAINKGGTGQTTAGAAFDALSPMTTLGDVIYGGASGTGTRLAGNTTATKKFLRQTGNGSISATPAWDTVIASDVGLGSVENTALSTWAGSANITTLGTIGSGTWHGSLIAGTYGGTGVNNGAKTLTYLKNISFTAADDTGVYTLPTGTKTLLATDGSAASLTNFPTFNQNTTGSAATLTTPRAIYGNNFDGSAALAGIIASTYGGTGNGFTKFSGPATSEKTFTLPDASATILTSNSAVTVAQGGTNATSASITAFNNITGYTAAGATGTTSTNLVFSTSPVLTAPNIGSATGTSLALTTTSGAQETLKYDTSNYASLTTASNGDFTVATTSGSSAGNINLNSAIAGDSTILGTSGTLVLGGSGATNNESLKLDFETNANKVGVTSGTGVTDIDLGSLNLITTGSLTMGSSTTATLVTRVKAGAATESDANGALVVDSTNGRIYFRYSGAWHYAGADGGFQIPANETIDPISGNEMKMGDLIVGMISQTDDGRDKFSDGALHAKYVTLANAIKEVQASGALLEAGASPVDGFAESNQVSGVSTGTLLDKVTNALFSLGVSITNGVTSIKNLAVEKFGAKTARIEKLEMVDSATGDIYCTWIASGEWVKAKGECGSSEVAVTASQLSQQTSDAVKQAADLAVTASAKEAANQAAEQTTQQINQNINNQIQQEVQSQIQSQVQIQVQAEVANQLQAQQTPAPSEPVPSFGAELTPPPDQNSVNPLLPDTSLAPQNQSTAPPNIFDVSAKPAQTQNNIGTFIQQMVYSVFQKIGEALGWIIQKITPNFLKKTSASLLEGTGHVLTDKIAAINDFTAFIIRK